MLFDRHTPVLSQETKYNILSSRNLLCPVLSPLTLLHPVLSPGNLVHLVLSLLTLPAIGIRLPTPNSTSRTAPFIYIHQRTKLRAVNKYKISSNTRYFITNSTRSYAGNTLRDSLTIQAGRFSPAGSSATVCEARKNFTLWAKKIASPNGIVEKAKTLLKGIKRIPQGISW